MAFEIKSFNDLVEDALNYLKANIQSPGSLNLYKGGRSRTLIESNALLLSQLYLYINDRMKSAASEGLYTALDFPALPAIAAVVTLTFTGLPGTVIPMGTIVQTGADIYTPSIQFSTNSSVQIPTGQAYVAVDATAVIPGSSGNVIANSLTSLLTSINGIQSVTNQYVPYITGQDAETEQQRAERFSEYVQALTGGTNTALNYAAQHVVGITKSRVIEPQLITCHTYTGSAYIDNSQEANTPWGTPFNMFNLTPSVGDILYIGANIKFNSFYINLATVGSGITGIWQYWNGSEWTALTVSDNAQVFTKNGSITFTVPTDWQATTVNSVQAFYTRFAVSAVSNPVNPLAYHILLLCPPPGWNNLVVYSSSGYTNELLQQVAASVADTGMKGSGTQVNVYYANTINADISLTAVVPVIYNNPTTQQNIVNTINDYINDLGIGEPLYLNHLTSLIVNADGAAVVAQIIYSPPTADIIPPLDTLVIPDNITVTLQSTTGS